MANQRRVFRMAERIQEILATEVRRASDPRFELVTVSSVVTTPDMRNAKVYWMVSGGPERIEEVQQAFDAATGHFKRSLAKQLDVKFVPDLKFYYDDTLDAAEEIDRLLKKISTT